MRGPKAAASALALALTAVSEVVSLAAPAHAAVSTLVVNANQPFRPVTHVAALCDTAVGSAVAAFAGSADPEKPANSRPARPATAAPGRRRVMDKTASLMRPPR